MDGSLAGKIAVIGVEAEDGSSQFRAGQAGKRGESRLYRRFGVRRGRKKAKALQNQGYNGEAGDHPPPAAEMPDLCLGLRQVRSFKAEIPSQLLKTPESAKGQSYRTQYFPALLGRQRRRRPGATISALWRRIAAFSALRVSTTPYGSAPQ
jgi:hypothetical protein